MTSDIIVRLRGSPRPLADRVPPHAFFAVSAVFHYLGPSFAVLLFARLDPPGVACLRIASAGLVFAAWRRPWHFLAALPRRDQAIILALGLVLAVINTVLRGDCSPRREAGALAGERYGQGRGRFPGGVGRPRPRR